MSWKILAGKWKIGRGHNSWAQHRFGKGKDVFRAKNGTKRSVWCQPESGPQNIKPRPSEGVRIECWPQKTWKFLCWWKINLRNKNTTSVQHLHECSRYLTINGKLELRLNTIQVRPGKNSMWIIETTTPPMQILANIRLSLDHVILRKKQLQLDVKTTLTQIPSVLICGVNSRNDLIVGLYHFVHRWFTKSWKRPKRMIFQRLWPPVVANTKQYFNERISKNNFKTITNLRWSVCWMEEVELAY